MFNIISHIRWYPHRLDRANALNIFIIQKSKRKDVLTLLDFIVDSFPVSRYTRSNSEGLEFNF
jgi:hypothetical protein